VLQTVIDGEKVLEKVTQTNSLEERTERAEQCLATLKLNLPTIIDKEDNKVNSAYAGWPDRFYVVGVDCKIAYKGEQGPKGFKPAEVEKWLKENTKAVAGRE
jgi:iodothyronine deiodinase-like protein